MFDVSQRIEQFDSCESYYFGKSGEYGYYNEYHDAGECIDFLATQVGCLSRLAQSQKNHGSVVALLTGKFLQKSGEFFAKNHTFAQNSLVDKETVMMVTNCPDPYTPRQTKVDQSRPMNTKADQGRP